MKVQTAGKDQRSDRQPSRAAVQASPAWRRREPAGRPRPARPRAQRCGGQSLRTPRQPVPGRRSERLAREAPRFALTLRAMFGTRQASAPFPGRSIFALSVLALLALACFPVLAHADSSGIQYSDAPPTVTGKNKIPTQSEPPAHSSKANGGATGAHNGGSSGGGSGNGSSSKPGGAPGAANKGGTGQQGSPGQGSTGNPGSGSQAVPSNPTSSSQDDSSSSPLVPILIAIAVLAAISIGVVMVRQRRRRNSSGVSVSPKAG
jgi:cobalamin biosynthesis Mg chelatase CobN